MVMRLEKIYKTTLWVQAIYTGITALWGLIDIDSFMAVTGPKTDIWLVKTISVVLLAIAICFVIQAIIPSNPLSVIVLALVISAGLAIIDVYYVLRGVISKVYLGDAVLEILFFVVWMLILINVKGLIKGANPR
jgi:hypothetical protein